MEENFVEDVYLLHFALSWEEHEKMCAADTSDIFKDDFTPFEKRSSFEDTCQSIIEEEEDNVQMQDQETVRKHELIDEECSLVQDQQALQMHELTTNKRNVKKEQELGEGTLMQNQEHMNEQLYEERNIKEEENMVHMHDMMNEESCNHGSETQLVSSTCSLICGPPDVNTEQEMQNLKNKENHSDHKSEVFDDSSMQSFCSTNDHSSSSVFCDGNVGKPSTETQPIWPLIESSFSMVSPSSSKSNKNKNLNLPPMDKSIKQSSLYMKTTLQKIASGAVPEKHLYQRAKIPLSFPPAIVKVATQQRGNCNKPNEDENLKLPLKMSNSIDLSSCNPKTIFSDVLSRLNFSHGTEILPPLPPGIDEVATQQERNSDTPLGSAALSKFSIVKTSQKKLTFHKCEMSSNQRQVPTRHPRAHLEDTNECHICKMMFRLKTDLRNHLDIVHSYREFCCGLCDKRFKISRDLRNHLQLHSSEKPFKCKLCEKAFRNASYLKTHMFVHTKKSKHFCAPCDKYFMSNTWLQIHIKRQHTAERPFKCSICNKGFVTNSKLKEHRLAHSDERPHQCSICKKNFKAKSTLNKHELTHKKREKKIPCDFCDKMFALPKEMIDHCRRVHWEKKLKWEECGKEFAKKNALKDHQFKHTGEKPYQCKKCGKCFAQRSAMYLHKADHLIEKRWKCEKCDKAFRHKGHFRRHILIHSGSKPFECDFCKKTFNRKYNLKIHGKLHTEEYLQKVAIRKKGGDQRNNGRKIKRVDDIDHENIEDTSDVPRVKRNSRKRNVVSYKEEDGDEFDFVIEALD